MWCRRLTWNHHSQYGVRTLAVWLLISWVMGVSISMPQLTWEGKRMNMGGRMKQRATDSGAKVRMRTLYAGRNWFFWAGHPILHPYGSKAPPRVFPPVPNQLLLGERSAHFTVLHHSASNPFLFISPQNACFSLNLLAGVLFSLGFFRAPSQPAPQPCLTGVDLLLSPCLPGVCCQI